VCSLKTDNRHKENTMNDDIGKLVLRLTLGILMLFHGIAKLRYGVSGIEGMVTSNGLPGFLAYGVFVGEVLAPLLVIFGFYARIGGLIMAINMVVAIALAHGSQLFDIGKSGGWALELQGLFLFTALVVALIGPGKFGINRQ
jgi:putative oxidoreductase